MIAFVAFIKFQFSVFHFAFLALEKMEKMMNSSDDNNNDSNKWESIFYVEKFQRDNSDAWSIWKDNNFDFTETCLTLEWSKILKWFQQISRDEEFSSSHRGRFRLISTGFDVVLWSFFTDISIAIWPKNRVALEESSSFKFLFSDLIN